MFACTKFSEVAPALVSVHTITVVQRGGTKDSHTFGERMRLMSKETRGRSFDDLAMSLESTAISRGKAIKLGGAALVAAALGAFGGGKAEAESLEVDRRRRCCSHRRRPHCHICCRRRRLEACCGRHGCRCCRRGRCDEGRCRRRR
jgi:hypothetical protein